MLNDFLNINDHIRTEIPLSQYGGSERKRAVIMDDGECYMLKFPDPAREQSLELSYINNAISEYLGCHVYASIGIPVQQTYLGEYTSDQKTRVACLCRDFQNDGLKLYEADKQDLGSLDGSTAVSLAGIQKLLDHLRLHGIDRKQMFRDYCDRVIVDGLIGNTDRHNGNWGFVMDKEGKIGFAPVYDCGSSYSPLLTDRQLTPAITNHEINNAMSALRDDHGTRIPFHVLFESGDSNIADAAQRVIPKIGIDKITNIIQSIPYISDARKRFYVELTNGRYEKQLIPLLEKSLNIKKSDEYKSWNSRVIQMISDLYLEPFKELPEGSRGKCKIKTQEYSYIVNSGHVFFMDDNDEKCIAFTSLHKTNQNICKFVQSMRNIGNEIDIEQLKTATKNEPENFLEKCQIAQSKAKAKTNATKLVGELPQHTRNKVL